MIEKLKGLLRQAATPWHLEETGPFAPCIRDVGESLVCQIDDNSEDGLTAKQARLVLLAVNALPALIEVAEAAQVAIDQYGPFSQRLVAALARLRQS